MKSRPTEYVPPKRKDAIVAQVGQEFLVLNTETNEAHCLNETASRVWALCDGKTSVAVMARALSDGAGDQLPEKIVWMALQQLRKARLLPKEPSFPNEVGFISRRQAMRKIGVAAGLALPGITSILVPTAAQAASCLPLGSACTSSSQCCSMNCLPMGHICAP
jgi:Coenzyme PQQ synthesis protein D (PqqD)